MKIKLINHQAGDEIKELNSLYVYDKEGNRYMIQLNKFGGINIQAEDGSLSVEPHVSNEITLKTF